MKKLCNLVVAAAFIATSVAAYAAVIIDDEGVGFVGKGDVQLVYGWNNAQLQANAESVQFRMSSVDETTWECFNSNNQKTQERTHTTTIGGLVSSVARLKNQYTGFNLNGYDGGSTTTTDGPTLNSCPSGPWSYVEGSTVTETIGGDGLEVSIDGVNWYPLQ
jgi:hypothetical protein